MSDNNDNDDRTIYCGNLSEKATEQILYELFFQVGPVERVSLPKDKDGMPRGFAFVTYVHLCSVRYAIELFYDTKLFGRNLTLKNRGANSNNDRNNSNSQRSSHSLSYGFNNSPGSRDHNMLPNILFNPNQMTSQQFTDNESQRMFLAQQQILLQLQAGSQMFGGGSANNSTFPSGSIIPHNDRGGNRSDFVERNKSGRDHQKEHKPYSRNRSRSPSSNNKYYDRNQSRQKTRSRSPTDNRSSGRGGNRDGSNRYALWGSNNNSNNNNYNNNGSRHRDRR
ncbi:unnamed protein product [Diamesa tonsa]